MSEYVDDINAKIIVRDISMKHRRKAARRGKGLPILKTHDVLNFKNVKKLSFSKFIDENYYALKNSLHEKEMFFDELERNNFYILLHNFVLDKINNHKLDLWNEYQDILERMIEKKIGVNFYGKINPQLFRNMVKVYSKNKNYDKANDFVENHYNDISEEHRYTNYYYSKALLMFFKGEFEKGMGDIVIVNVNRQKNVEEMRNLPIFSYLSKVQKELHIGRLPE